MDFRHIGFILKSLILVALSGPPQVFAEDREPAAVSSANDPDEIELTQKVKSRSYNGGSDESDLKVQNQLTKPTRKIAPTTEDSSEPAAAQD